MLYLNPPFPVINGVTLFPDHSRPDVFYYLGIAPHVTRIHDSVTGEDIPQIQLIKYRGSAGTGGFLNFDVNLGLETDALRDIAGELRNMMQLRDDPILSPAPLIDGSVRMMLFGKQTETDEDGDDTSGGSDDDGGDGPEFVLHIDQAAKPSLYGDNQAAFSVSLDQYGVTLLEAALQGEMSPIGIVYSLEFLALRRAYAVEVKAQWDRVQTHFEESFGVDTLIVSAQIDEIVDKLIEDRIIEINIDTFVLDDDDAAGVIGRRDEAVAEVREMVTDAFFEPSLDPYEEKEDGWDKAAGFTQQISQIGAFGGQSAMFKYKKLDYTRIDKKSLNVRMNERMTVKRTVYPQGHLSGLFRTLRSEGVDLDRFVIEADLDDPWFARRKVTAISRANYTEDKISSVNVKMRYAGEAKNRVLDQPGARTDFDWASVVENGVMKKELETSYAVTFDVADRGDRPLSLEAPPRPFDLDILEVNPRELYSIVDVKIIAKNFPWETYPHVEVHTRYVDEKNSLNAGESFMLEQSNEDETWKLFMLDPERREYEYKIIYRAADHKDIEQPWVRTPLEEIAVRNPFPNRYEVEIFVSSSVWEEAERAFVDVRYTDRENGVSEAKSFKFKQGDDGEGLFRAPLVNPEHRTVRYKVTFMMKNGSIVEVPESYTRQTMIFVSRGMKGHKLVEVRPDDVGFDSKQLKEMTVELSYESPEETARDRFTFRSKDDKNYFEYNFSDANAVDYRYQTTYVFTNGLSRQTDWQTNSEELLILPVG